MRRANTTKFEDKGERIKEDDEFGMLYVEDLTDDLKYKYACK